MSRPWAMASRITARSGGDSSPLVGATPTHEALGVLGLHRRGEVGDDRDPVAHAVEHLAGVAAGLGAVDDRRDLVPLGLADQPVGGLAVDLGEVALAEDGGRAAASDRWWTKTSKLLESRLRGGDGIIPTVNGRRSTRRPQSALG